MADWTAFGAVAGLVLVLVLALARVTTAALSGDGGTGTRPPAEPGATSEASSGPRGGSTSSEPRGGPTSSEPRGGPTPADRRSESPSAATESESTGTEPGDRRSTDTAQPDSRAAATRSAASRSRRASGAAADDAGGAPSTLGSTSRAGGDGSQSGPGSGAREPVAGANAGGDAPGARRDQVRLPPVSTPALLGNVVVTHGALAAVLAGAAGMTGVPAAALGIADAAWSTGAPAVLAGLGLGVALALANGVAAANLERLGIDHSDALRTALAPSSGVGWALLLVVILPLVALFEELLFRSVLVGAPAAATGVSPWLFVVPSSIAFAAGHGLQGRGGVLVTGILGCVLAVAFVLTNSLLLVVVAHYVVNAAEFLLHEWLGVDVHGRLAV